MSENQLRRAYELIKEGREQEAIDIIEPLIRFDPDNGDAWWLLANATEDAESKRNALNNVLRLSDNPTRVEKAQQMLRILNTSQPEADIFEDFGSFDDSYGTPVKRSGEMPPQQAPIIVKERGGGVGRGCCMGCLGIIGVLVVISCIGVFALATLAPRVFEEGFDFLTIPAESEYRDGGALEPGQFVEGEVRDSDDRIGYLYSTTRAENVNIRIETPSGAIPPLVFVYNRESGQLMQSNWSMETSTGVNGLAEFDTTFPSAGEYLIVVRPFPFVGFGVAEYTLEIIP